LFLFCQCDNCVDPNVSYFMDSKYENTLLETANLSHHLLNVNISMTVGQIFTKIGNFIENRQIFMLLNCNCARLANFEDFYTCLWGGAFFVDTVYVSAELCCI